MEEGTYTVESELHNWFEDYVPEDLLRNATKSFEQRFIVKPTPPTPNGVVSDELHRTLTNLFEIGYSCGMNDDDDTKQHHIEWAEKMITVFITQQTTAAERESFADGYCAAYPISSTARDTAYKIYDRLAQLQKGDKR